MKENVDARSALPDTAHGQQPPSATPRLAHLFLVRGNLNHEQIWKDFLRGNEDRHTIYVHPKWPDQVTAEWIRERIIAHRCETEYASISLVEAELHLLQAALQDEQNQFFLLHSESCVPIRAFDVVYRRILELGQSWLSYHQANMERYERINQQAVRRVDFHKASQFFCLSRPHAQFIVDHDMLADWRHCVIPDEHYIPTLLAMHGRLNECAQRSLTYADWASGRQEGGWGPATFHQLLPSDVNMLHKTDCLFARKFAKDGDIEAYVPGLFCQGT
jgi:hypothetical protein